MSKKLFVTVGIVLIILILIALVVKLGLDSPRVNYRDNQRKSALSATSIALELYFNEHGQYPGNDDLRVEMTEGQSCVTAQGEGNLFDVIGMGLRTDSDVERDYKYGVNKPQPDKYVLMATFDSEDRIPEDDLDGNIFGCDCNGLNYCLGKFKDMDI